MKTYIVEVRNPDCSLCFGKKEAAIERAHPYLFGRGAFSIDELCYYASFGQGRNKPIGPMELPAFMNSIGVSYREKTW